MKLPGDISKPLDTLIKKVSKGLGMLWEPYQIKRVAKAEASALITITKAEIQHADLVETGLRYRAGQRVSHEEIQKQKNIENILAQTSQYLKEDTDASHMDDDWVTNFFDKARVVSNKEMQVLWTRILAGEANVPGSYSRRTVNFLNDLDRFDAELFAKLCGFLWEREDNVSLKESKLIPSVFDFKARIYKDNGINFSSLNHLESIGLVNIFDQNGYSLYAFKEYVQISYGEQMFVLKMPKFGARNKLPLGRVRLTKIGNELASICDRKSIDGFVVYAQEKWKARLVDCGACKNSLNLP